MGKERTPIELNTHLNGAILYAEGKKDLTSKWIFLVASVEDRRKDYGSFHIRRWASYDFCEKRFNVETNLSAANWGYTNGYNIYLATDEEKQIIKDGLKKRGVKYIRALNKLIPR
jgi:hypothetical protein